MYYFEKLKQAILVDKKVVTKVDKYIKTKYPNNTDSANNDIIKDALNKVIKKELEALNIREKEAVINDVIEQAITNKGNDITKYDVLKVCSNVIDNQSSSIKEIGNWIEDSVDYQVHNDDVVEFLDNIKGIDYLGDYSIVQTETHQEELVTIPHVVLKSTRDLMRAIKGFLTTLTPKEVYNIARISFIAILIMTGAFYMFNENVGMAESNGVLAQKEYRSNLAESYEVYSREMKKAKVDYDILACHPFLPDYFDYIEIDEIKLKEYLSNRNSLLIEDEYFYDIIQTSKEFNLNPLILFAITGQEQGFVPKSDEEAKQIVNNPFNVFVSWKHYNTDIKDSSEIAARTVINLGKGAVEGINIFKWINRLYADDSDWYKGVEALFWDMMEYCELK
ncbi:hypothetical protein [Oceanirhabdus sp. W0125-5]|uniref:hypothetical protein n=1 Tax=Oceanirhabdus sp. W0125-5 TaxID=2999116 RepID=UPI0022F2D8C6|nr:hypothetical protein [Oceanirhabdus sp. W0125-5]WBW97377.1 hypothetical protein OW730_00555 [Oceanirhabdus sp. W0125-5]